MPAAKQNPRQPEREAARASESRDAPILTTRAAVVPSSIDAKNRTVEVTWSTGAEVQRMDWYSGQRYRELLSMDEGHIRLERLRNGAPVLNTHGRYDVSDVLGVVESAEVNGGEGRARIRFSERAAVEPVWQDVRAGIIRGISVGYSVHKWQVDRAEGDKLEKRTAVDWEPYELSLVPIPADAGAQVRAYDDEGSASAEHAPGATPGETETSRALEGQQEPETMSAANNRSPAETPTTPTTGTEPETRGAPAAVPAPTQPDLLGAERQRVAAIDDLCRVHNVDAGKRSKWLSDGATVDAVRSVILDDIGERQRATHVSPITHSTTNDAAMRRDASDALLRRSGEKVEGEGHRNFNDGHLVDMARTFLERGGVNTKTLSRMQIAERALATSDFSGALYLAGEKTMRAGYDSVPLVHRVVLKRASASDFRPKNTVAVDAGDLLEEVPEGGPIPEKGARFEKSAYAIKSYGKIVAFTRKMLIDDDIDALTGVSRARGRSAAETERKLVWDFILGNPDAPDENSVFDNTNHKNFPNAAAATCDVTSLDLANSFFRNAPSLSNIAINAAMRYIVASSSADLALDRLLNSGYLPAAAATGITERDRRITVLCEPMVGGATDKQHWLGFADYNQASSFEFAYLAGTADGVRLEQKVGFEVEGISLKVCLDFGVGCSDWRGVYYRRQT